MGRRDLWGIGGVGDWGEVEKYMRFYHWISNSEIIAVLFFGMIEIHFLPQRVVISVMFLRGFGKLFDVPRKLQDWEKNLIKHGG